MSLLLYLVPLLFLFFTFPTPSLSQNDTAPCPLNITVLNAGSRRISSDSGNQCPDLLRLLRLLQADYFRRTGFFVPPLSSAESCWKTFQTFINEFIPSFDIRSSCGLQTSWISRGCPNITTRQQFESKINPVLQDVKGNCNRSLDNDADCNRCTNKLSSSLTSIPQNPDGGVSDCRTYAHIYAASLSDQFGVTDAGTVKCLFGLDFSSSGSDKNWRIVAVVVPVLIVLDLVLFGGFWGYLRWKGKRVLKSDGVEGGTQMSLPSGLDSMKLSNSLINFTFDDILKATRNFSKDNIIGIGGYGHVYKGMLLDGTQVAFKRFKNCSVAGDASFTHEVEVIAHVRHVNLVALRGYCTATTNSEGHQRIIVTDLMENGSLYDHLFRPNMKKLSWPIRQKIALGTARGLAYLHYGAQPSIIHRDIKARNILLDRKFEAKVADFGLAKFNPEGMTHVSTRVAGTRGYLAPEYALYGQLTERSDVYSFGVVLLELLSGKKALQMDNDGDPITLPEMAWSLVRDGRALDVIEGEMPEPGPPQVLEKYVLVAVLCSHPQLYARPTMDQVVKMLETDDDYMPSIMERPIPSIAGRIDIEKSASNSGLCIPTGYQAYTMQTHSLSNTKEEGNLGSWATMSLTLNRD